MRVIGPGAEAMTTRILPLRYPDIETLCRLTPVDTPSLAVPEGLAGTLVGPDIAGPSVAIVATGDRDETARTAMLLVRWLPAECRVVAALPSAPSLLKLLLDNDAALAARLAVVDLSGALDHPTTLLGGPREELARLGHEDWLRAQLARGSSLAPEGPLQHWDNLAEEFKSSNRSQTAALFDEMLPAIGATIVPVAEWDAAPFVLTSEEIEKLARLEHERWCDERERAGWVLDAALDERDAERKRSPWLIPYDELPETQKDNDRDVATRMPVMLARAGFRLRRAADA